MKSNKNTALIYALGAAALVALLSSLDKSSSSKPIKITLQDITDALRIIKNKFGTEVAKKVEQVFRIETSNFTSGQFLLSRSAGMVAVKDTFPFGWTKFKDLWQSTPKSAPVGLTKIFRVDNKDYRYLVFPSMLAAMVPLALVIQKGGVGAWGGTANYAQGVSTITPKIVNSFT